MIKKLLFFTLVMFSLIWAENQDYDSDDAEVEYDDLEGSIIFKDYYYMQPASEGVSSPMGTVSIVSSNECLYIRLKDAVKNPEVTNRLKKRIDAYMNATVEWFHNDAYKEGCDELSSIFKEECKEPRYDHFDGPYSLIECPDVKEIEKYVPRDLIP